jgi:TonB family protein
MKKTAFALIVLFLSLALPARADVGLDIKLHFFGPAAGQGAGTIVATSFSLKPLRLKSQNPGDPQLAFAPDSLLLRLQKAFNNPGLSLLSSGDLAWRVDGPPSVMQVVQIDGRDYALILTPLPRPGVVNFKVGVVEGNDKKKIKNVLLDTEIVLPDREVAMLGFRDSRENSYFIAFYVQSRKDGPATNALRLSSMDKPRKVKDVKPVFPAAAIAKGIQGVVVLEAVIDANGRVKGLQTMSAPDPMLSEAAKEAVSQWLFEPYLVNGKAKEVVFTVTITFAMDPNDKAKTAGDVLTRLEDSQKPKIINKVKPVYPEEAKKNKIQGIVKLEATIDEQGKVAKLDVLASPDPLLAAAAVQAVKQWVYEPYVKDGKAKSVLFTVTITFALE